MQVYDLEGEWQFGALGGPMFPGRLPGCNYLDLLANGLIEDPFWGTNEGSASKIAEGDFLYTRRFTLPPSFLEQDAIELVIGQIDLFASIFLNGRQIAETGNAFRTYRFDVTRALAAGENLIELSFKSPLPYMREQAGASPAKNAGMGIAGKNSVRKPQYHFGWDWGPNLPPVGIRHCIRLEAFTAARLDDVRIEQTHGPEGVAVKVAARVTPLGDPAAPLRLDARITAPDGAVLAQEGVVAGNRAACEWLITQPQLWWCNGLGPQPLYQVEVTLLGPAGVPLDTWRQSVGLRTLCLDTAADAWGSNFRFFVNGVPIFAKGANWIPSDSFVNRTSWDDLDFYIRGAADAHMNMLRVWGGGYYESEDFYSLCDRWGILVWQDFAFACSAYPLGDPGFLENLRQEVRDTVRRLRHHPSLALWCGNNEVFLGNTLVKKNPAALAQDAFFYQSLPRWVAEEDPHTPYWPGSPCSGDPAVPSNALGHGDTHLWQVWHGMKPVEAFRKMPTRFCSEFGLEAMPPMGTVRGFTAEPVPALFGPALRAHQKSPGGTEKMRFYLLSKFRNPAAFEDFVYLSQITQAEGVRGAVEYWRRNPGRCNGALYWQYNDCWPAASWASIGYKRQYKALQYHAKEFYAMLALSCELGRGQADVYVLNDYPRDFEGLLKWTLADFQGNEISSGASAVQAGPAQGRHGLTLRYKEILKGRPKASVLLTFTLCDGEGRTRFTRDTLLVPDKQAKLPKPVLETRLSVEGAVASLTLRSDTLARYVYVHVDGLEAPLSDNFFTLGAKGAKTVTFPVPAEADPEALLGRVRVKTLADVRYKGSFLREWWYRLRARAQKNNLLFWAAFKFAGSRM
jgi:beta-mannosidase